MLCSPALACASVTCKRVNWSTGGGSSPEGCDITAYSEAVGPGAIPGLWRGGELALLNFTVSFDRKLEARFCSKDLLSSHSWG